MKYICIIFAFLLLSLPLFALPVAAAGAQGSADYAIDGGRFFTQAAAGEGGFSVVDDEQARFWSEFQRLGLQNVGYPISRRFIYDGFVTQAFQKLVLQWRPEVGQAWPVNIFDELSRHGFDDRLLVVRQTPHPLTDFDPPGASWNQIIANRQALLNANPAIRARYFSVADPLNTFGLPTSRVEDMGNHYAIRTQRAVFQQWKETVPWASAGQVTVANGGDIAKEMGWLAGAAIQPEPAPGQVGPPPPLTHTTPWNTSDILVGSGTPSRLYAFQNRSVGLPNENRAVTEHRLLVSDDLGTTWSGFAGSPPFEEDCVFGMTIDPNVQAGLYATTCQGFYRWTGSAWNKIADQGNAVTPGNPEQLWAMTTSTILQSDDGGENWVEAAANLNGGTMGLGTPGDIIVVPGNPPTAYAMLAVGRSGTTILRATPGGEWTPLLPEPPELSFAPYTVELHRATGTLYLSSPLQRGLWRIPNPMAEPEALEWERFATPEFGGKENISLLAAAQGTNGVVLFVNAFNNEDVHQGTPATTYRSLDDGATWQAITFP